MCLSGFTGSLNVIASCCTVVTGIQMCVVTFPISTRAVTACDYILILMATLLRSAASVVACLSFRAAETGLSRGSAERSRAGNTQTQIWNFGMNLKWSCPSLEDTSHSER